MPKVFTILPLSPDFDDVYSTIVTASVRASEETGLNFIVIRSDKEVTLKPAFKKIDKRIEEADIIIADISEENISCLYQLGYAHALRKPTILIAQIGKLIFDFFVTRVIIYDRKQLHKKLLKRLSALLIEAHKTPKVFIEPYDPQTKKLDYKPTAFISYSHADKECLERLQVHLKPLKRKNLVDIWADTKIKAGEKWKEQIISALNKAVVAVLLISADFLASDFILDNELPPLLASAEKRGTVILPVILKPCGFKRDENLSCFQAINSPDTPLLKLNKIEQEEIYSKIAETIEIEIKNKIKP